MICAVPITSAAPPAETTADGYRLVWHDEFNKDGPLNPADWGSEQGFVRNEELQWYQPENVVCKDGFLVIEARKESKPNPRYVAPGTSSGGGRAWQNRPTIEVTSASITTRGKHSWLYGRFEIRAKIDTRSGSWPAFWTLGTQGRWPASGEIDIMEVLPPHGAGEHRLGGETRRGAECQWGHMELGAAALANAAGKLVGSVSYLADGLGFDVYQAVSG